MSNAVGQTTSVQVSIHYRSYVREQCVEADCSRLCLVLHTNKDVRMDASLAVLSGIGTHKSDTRPLAVPLMPDAEWTDVFGMRHGGPDGGPPIQVILRRSSGFVCHASCWTVFSRRVESMGITVDDSFVSRLYEVCYSMPYSQSSSLVKWGHNYGGMLHPCHSEKAYPWEDSYGSAEMSQDLVEWMACDPAAKETAEEFVAVAMRKARPEENLWRSTEKAVPSIHQRGQNPEWLSHILGSDPFIKTLHPDICTLIAEALPTEDVMRLRLASRAFRYTFDQESFWATRFWGDGERSWLYEALDMPFNMDEHYLSWKALYHVTKPSQVGNELSNRIRIWNVIPSIMEWVKPYPINPPYFLYPHAAQNHLKDWRRRSVRGLINQHWKPSWPFEQGCRLLRTYDSDLTDDSLSRIAVYFVDTGVQKHVCGLQLWFGDRENMLGYYSNAKEYLNFTDGGLLYGITVAAGSQGIHALKFHPVSGQECHWVGDPRDRLISHRLIPGGDRICRLVSEFDVSLAKEFLVLCLYD